jgi:hypothetical protein
MHASSANTTTSLSRTSASGSRSPFLALKVVGVAVMLAATAVVGLVAAGTAVPGVPAGDRVELSSDSQWAVDALAAQVHRAPGVNADELGATLAEGAR